ncbi:MAG: 16S rRNA (guanine(527)-N(7))-methyltransferase RsmG [Acidobacteriota bacterium]|nr:16S rRNA (guanine(527)-N(7))-methyltransferase RsmG [Acidobacteriota bacterium]
MLTHAKLKELLAPFGVELDEQRLEQVSTYLRVLMRWNERINLTAVRNEQEVVTRHFGESLFLARIISLYGRLLDIGSGAGFPGLALKVAFPELNVTLLEPVSKKRAFLKEVARECGFVNVDARPERLEDFVPTEHRFESVTMRAVGDVTNLVTLGLSALADSGRLALWLSRNQAVELLGSYSDVIWEAPVNIPGSRERVILIGSGVRRTNPSDGGRDSVKFCST